MHCYRKYEKCATASKIRYRFNQKIEIIHYILCEDPILMDYIFFFVGIVTVCHFPVCYKAVLLCLCVWSDVCTQNLFTEFCS